MFVFSLNNIFIFGNFYDMSFLCISIKTKKLKEKKDLINLFVILDKINID